MTSSFQQQVAQGERFEFGKNWQSFLSTLTPEKIAAAETSLKQMLEFNSLSGKDFLDIGCGSGLFSLAARRLGAQVCSLDYDPESVWCAYQLKYQYFPDDPHWEIHQASVLDAEFMNALKSFDIVYSWGVLHHTGAMWPALTQASSVVASQGLLFIAIYNRHWTAPIWKLIKLSYNKSPTLIRKLMVFQFYGIKWLGALLTTGENPTRGERGMNFKHDLIDWLGGYPYEYASCPEIKLFLEKQGFELIKMVPTVGWTGCNQFVFLRTCVV